MRTALLLGTATALVVLTGCGSPAPGPTDPHAGHQTSAPVESTAPVGSSAAGLASPTDLAYTQLVISQLRSSLPLLDLARAQATDPAVSSTATTTGVRYRDFARRYTLLLEEAGQRFTDEHDGHDMPGMVTADELHAVEGLSGAPFDARARQLMCAQFTETDTVATSELGHGSDPAVLALTRQVQDAVRALTPGLC